MSDYGVKPKVCLCHGGNGIKWHLWHGRSLNSKSGCMASDEVNGPPPSKRARLDDSTTSKKLETSSHLPPDKNSTNESELIDEEEEEEVMRELGETRPSDLYLDTVRLSFFFYLFNEKVV